MIMLVVVVGNGRRLTGEAIGLQQSRVTRPSPCFRYCAMLHTVECTIAEAEDGVWPHETRSMDAGSDHGSAAKGSAIDLEVASSGPVSCRFFISLLFLTMCSSLTCLSFVTMVCRPSSLVMLN